MIRTARFRFEASGSISGWNTISSATAGTKVTNAVDSSDIATDLDFVFVTPPSSLSSASSLLAEPAHGYSEQIWERYAIFLDASAIEFDIQGFPASCPVTVTFAGLRDDATRDVRLTASGNSATYDNISSALPIPTANVPAPASFSTTADASGVLSCVVDNPNGTASRFAFVIVEYDDAYVAGPTISDTLEDPPGTPWVGTLNVRIRTLAGSTVVGPVERTTNASGVWSITDAALTAATEYEVSEYTSDYTRSRLIKLTAV